MILTKHLKYLNGLKKILNKIDKTFRNKKNIVDTIKVLQIVLHVLDKHKVKYYLDFGTLIGVARDNALIPWDDDIDISLYDETDYKKIKSIVRDIKWRYNLRTYLYTFKSSRDARRKNGNPIYVENISFTNEKNYQILKIKDSKFWIFGRGNVTIDIFFKYKYKEKSYWFSDGKENSIPLEYSSDEMQEITFYGIQCKIPKKYNEYLTYKYGNWKVPNEKWSHENDDYSINNSN